MSQEYFIEPAARLFYPDLQTRRALTIGDSERAQIWSFPSYETGGHEWGAQTCIKVVREDVGMSLGDEFTLWSRITTEIKKVPRLRKIVLVPYCHCMVDPKIVGVERWQDLQARFPMMESGSIICERIGSLGFKYRERLVARYGDSDSDSDVQAAARQHCLAKLDFEADKLQLPRPFTLRNFPCTVNDSVFRRVKFGDTIRVVGGALAFLNWHIGVDGAGVDFVFGRQRHKSSQALWMLGFDKCQARGCSVESILETLNRSSAGCILKNLDTSCSYGGNVEFIERIAAVAAEIVPTREFPYEPHLQMYGLVRAFFQGYREMGLQLLEGFGDEVTLDRLFHAFFNRLCYAKSQSAAGALQLLRNA